MAGCPFMGHSSHVGAAASLSKSRRSALQEVSTARGQHCERKGTPPCAQMISANYVVKYLPFGAAPAGHAGHQRILSTPLIILQNQICTDAHDIADDETKRHASERATLRGMHLSGTAARLVSSATSFAIYCRRRWDADAPNLVMDMHVLPRSDCLPCLCRHICICTVLMACLHHTTSRCAGRHSVSCAGCHAKSSAAREQSVYHAQLHAALWLTA